MSMTENCRKLLLNCLLLTLSACVSAPGSESLADTTIPTSNSISVETIQVTGIENPTLGITPILIKTPTFQIMPGEEPTFEPTPDYCAAGFIAYTVQVRLESTELESGVYIACADGSFLQNIFPFEYAAPEITAQSPKRLAVFSDGSGLVFSYFDVIDDMWYVSMIDLDNHEVTELLAEEDILRNAQPSPNGEYLAYLGSAEAYLGSYLEILHIESGTTSKIVELENIEIVNFDWAPDGWQILLDELGPLGQNQISQAYIIDIECNPDTHICVGSDQRLLPNVLTDPSWTSDSLIISASESGPDIRRVIRISDLDGNIVREIELAEISSELQYTDITQPILSPNGIHIAFLNSYVDIFVLNLDDMTVHALTPDVQEVVYSTLEWLP